MIRYLLSLIVPVPMRSTHAATVSGADVRAGGHGNHYRDDDHHDLVSARWAQWRGRCLRQRTTTTCIGA